VPQPPGAVRDCPGQYRDLITSGFYTHVFCSLVRFSDDDDDDDASELRLINL